MEKRRSNDGKKRHHSGRKWCFSKEENGEVFTLHQASRSPILSQDGTEPGYVVNLKPSGQDSSKLKVKYSSGKSLLLDLTYLNPTDDLNRELYKEIGNISKFGEKVVKVLNVEFSQSSCGKRPSGYVGELDENQTKRRCPETRSTSSRTPSQESPEVALPVEVLTPPNVSEHHCPETSSTSTIPSRDSPEVILPIEASTPTNASTNVLTAPSTISTPSIDESDGITSEQQRYAISLCPRKVLVSTLKPPRKEYKLRDIDDLFVKSLIAEFKDNEVLFGLKPLLVIVKGVSKHEEFQEELLDSYELEVIGGNHRRAAMQHFLQENPDDLKYKYTEVILLTEMPKRVVLQIAFNHNRMDRFHHGMTTQEKVKLCHSILQDEFGGKRSTEWRNYCSAVINSKDSLDFIFLLSGLEEEAFQILEDVFHAFELFKIKDQTSSVSQAKKLLSGAIQQPNLVASKFKCIRGLDTRQLSGLFRKIADGKLSFAELKQHASEIKDLQVLKTEFVKKTGCKSWEEAVERFPDFTTEDLLKQFRGSIRKGKAGTDYQALIERALKAEVAEDDNGHSTQLTWKDGLWYGALSSREHTISAELLKDIPFTGADLTLIQAQENWSEDKVKAIVRQICGLNTRTGMSNYTIVVRTKASLQSLEECTPGGKGHVMFVAWSGISAKAGTGLTDVVEKTSIIFVGTPLRSATNWFVARKEEDIMRHLMQLFVPPRGILLELGNLQIQVSSCLKPSLEFKVNLLSIYDKQRPVNAFKKEVTALAHNCQTQSDSDEGGTGGD